MNTALQALRVCVQQYESQSSKTIENPQEVYKLWAAENPPGGIKNLRGKYGQSGHFTKEYEMYMKLKASNHWIKQFVTQNKLRPVVNEPYYPSDAPDWFKPLSSYNVYSSSTAFDKLPRYQQL